jgi:hypothetical protein
MHRIIVRDSFCRSPWTSYITVKAYLPERKFTFVANAAVAIEQMIARAASMFRASLPCTLNYCSSWLPRPLAAAKVNRGLDTAECRNACSFRRFLKLYCAFSGTWNVHAASNMKPSP